MVQTKVDVPIIDYGTNMVPTTSVYHPQPIPKAPDLNFYNQWQNETAAIMKNENTRFTLPASGNPVFPLRRERDGSLQFEKHNEPNRSVNDHFWNTPPENSSPIWRVPKIDFGAPYHRNRSASGQPFVPSSIDFVSPTRRPRSTKTFVPSSIDFVSPSRRQRLRSVSPMIDRSIDDPNHSENPNRGQAFVPTSIDFVSPTRRPRTFVPSSDFVSPARRPIIDFSAPNH
jgi:hypothetical protein